METRAIEPNAWYRLSTLYNVPGRKGLLDVGRTWVFDQIAAGRLKTRKIGPRATVVAGSDLLTLLGGQQ